MNVRLILERKRKRIWTTQLHRPESTLGRARGCTIRIPSSEVSRLHCRIHIEKGRVYVEDLESVNGTFINGERVEEIQLVRPGDRLSLGSITFLVEYELKGEPARKRTADLNEDVLEALDDVVLEEASDQLVVLEPAEDKSSIPTEDHIPLVEEVDEVQEVGADVSLFSDQSDVQLPDGGDLRDFLLELDDTDESSKKPQ